MLKYVGYDIVFREIPDEVTLAVNLSLCPNHCKGCHSPYLQKDMGQPLNEESLRAMLEPYRNEITCVCLMGGDGDPAEVARLSQHIKKQYGGAIKTGWYSGRAQLPDGFPQKAALDYIKLGPYLEQCGPLDNPKTNQSLYSVSSEGGMTDITARFWRKKQTEPQDGNSNVK